MFGSGWESNHVQPLQKLCYIRLDLALRCYTTFDTWHLIYDWLPPRNLAHTKRYVNPAETIFPSLRTHFRIGFFCEIGAKFSTSSKTAGKRLDRRGSKATCHRPGIVIGAAIMTTECDRLRRWVSVVLYIFPFFLITCGDLTFAARVARIGRSLRGRITFPESRHTAQGLKVYFWPTGRHSRCHWATAWVANKKKSRPITPFQWGTTYNVRVVVRECT